jgi:glycosyltransferase involved in cell wall biosynthesis
MARILFVGIAPPVPTNSGQRMRTRVLLEALKQEGHQVTLVSFADTSDLKQPHPEMQQLCAASELLASPTNGMAGNEYWNRFVGLFSRLPYGAQRMRSEPMLSAVKAALGRQSFDLVICADIYMLANIPSGLKIPILLNKDDLTFVIVNQFAQSERNPLKKAYARLEYRRIFRSEMEGCSSVTRVLVCSEHDKDVLTRLGIRAPISVVPNVVDVDSYQTQAAGSDDRTLLFVGAMDWLPNRDGVEYFITEILPLVRKELGAFRFVVAGRNPPEDFRLRFAGVPELEFTGTVKDMRAVISKAAICVVPLRIGSGTRLKILEAAAMGKAIVSTSLGAEGLEFQNGRDIAIADRPDAFASAIAQLFKDSDLRAKMGNAARQVAERRYSLPVLRESLRSALEIVSVPSK